jgi:hypothetical protein
MAAEVDLPGGSVSNPSMDNSEGERVNEEDPGYDCLGSLP